MIKVRDISNNFTSKNITMAFDVDGISVVATFLVVEFLWGSYVENISITGRDTIKRSVKKKVRDYIKSTYERTITLA